MTESQAWREIARRIAEGDWRQSGLCAEIGRLELPMRVEDALIYRVDSHQAEMDHDDFEGIGSGYMYAFHRGDAEPRILAALFLSLEAADDAKASISEAA